MNSFILAILVLLIPIGFSSCNHEMSVNPKKPSNEVLHFESVRQMQEELSSVIKMTTEEKVVWANQEGFNSFGVNADKFYDAIDPDQFKSKEEIVAFINHSKYLELVTEEDGEQSVQTKEADNKYRYFVNEDKIFTVEDKVVKVIGNKTVIACIDNLEKLKEIQFVSDEVINNPDFSVMSPKSILLKSYPGCGLDKEVIKEDYDDGTEKYYRVILHVWVEDNFNIFTGENRVETHYKIKSQRKSGVYFDYKNDIHYDMHIISHYYNGLGYTNSHVFNLAGIDADSKVFEDSEVTLTANFNYDAQAYLYELNCTAYVPETENVKAKLNCN